MNYLKTLIDYKPSDQLGLILFLVFTGFVIILLALGMWWVNRK